MHMLQRVYSTWISSLWRHKERNGVLNHRRLDSLLNCLFRRRSKKTSKLRFTGLCDGNLPMTGDFPAQRASNAENVSIWWRHHVIPSFASLCFLLTSFIFMTNKKTGQLRVSFNNIASVGMWLPSNFKPNLNRIFLKIFHWVSKTSWLIPITKIPKSASTGDRSDTYAEDRCLIVVNPMRFAIRVLNMCVWISRRMVGLGISSHKPLALA